MPRPFQQLPFDTLPAEPRVPHVYFDSEVVHLELSSPVWGAHRVHVRRMGSGPPLLLIHGLMTSSYSWRYVLRHFGQRFTVYAPDLPGAGRSDCPEGPYLADHLADWIGEVQDALGIRGCAVIGNSMGGYLSMLLALRDPEAMSRLVNLHSPGIPMLRLHALRGALSLPGSGGLLTWLVRRDVERWVHRHVHYYDETLKSLEETQEYAQPLRRADGVQAFRSYLRDTLDPRRMRAFLTELESRRERQERFPVPLLLVYSDQDPMVPPQVGDQLAAQIPGSRLVRLQQASHFAHVDAVERFLPPVDAFLQEDPK